MKNQDNIRAKSWRPTVSTEPSNQLEETLEDAPFYTLIRQNGATADFLNICPKNGDEMALPIPTIKRIGFSREKNQIVIRFDYESLITISGRNLKELHRHLLRLKISEIREYPLNTEKQFGESELYISNIEIEDGEKEE